MPYSHTHGGKDEVTFKDLVNGRGSSKVGYDKIRFCGEQASRNNLKYFWIDTCCIDKSNAAELQEAINSMYQWHRNFEICYVYLADVLTVLDHEADEHSANLLGAGVHSK
ncbi:hypothetical protein F5Y18DRAFT_423017 [Xylariaceae sp. FL1019]|nr:hypothetical protein F5Y18DRAFT_423017 [Xylariaceae sp. FL1019]